MLRCFQVKKSHGQFVYQLGTGKKAFALNRSGTVSWYTIGMR